MSNVQHPKHYNAHPSGVEAITIIEHMSFNVGNAMKYLWRADEKGEPIEDLEKAAWYINREIERRKKTDSKEIIIEGHEMNCPSIHGMTCNCNVRRATIMRPTAQIV